MNADKMANLAPLAQILVNFANAVTMFFVAVVIKALIKRPALAAAEAKAAERAKAAADDASRDAALAVAKEKWDEAKFDNFRVGVDITLLGLSTYLTVLEVSWERIGDTYLARLNALLIPIQLLLLLLIIALMMTHADSSKGAWSWEWFCGVYVPLVLGGFSILFSMAFILAVYIS